MSVDPARPDEVRPGPPPSAIDEPHPPARERLWLFAVALALVVLDLWSKAHVFQMLEDPAVEKVREGNLERILLFGEWPWLAWMRNLNYGAAFGQLTQIPHLLVILRCGAVLLVSWFILRAPRGQGVYLTALVMILAGAAGNLYDNFFFRPYDHDPTRPFGPVRDFIDFYVPAWDWHFATFNVADACISVGAVLLILSGLGGDPEEASPAEPAEG